MKCQHCGNENPEFSRFCSECGTDLLIVQARRSYGVAYLALWIIPIVLGFYVWFFAFPVISTRFGEKIRWDEAHRYIGTTKTACGMVVLVSQPTLSADSYHLSFGNYPGENTTEILFRTLDGRGLNVLIDQHSGDNFKTKPNLLLNKAICVKGLIMYAPGGGVFVSIDDEWSIWEQ